MKKLFTITLIMALLSCKKEPLEYPIGALVTDNLDSMNPQKHLKPPYVVDSLYADYKEEGKKYWVHDQNCFKFNTMAYQVEKYTGDTTGVIRKCNK